MANFDLLKGIDWGTKLKSNQVTYAFAPAGVDIGEKGSLTIAWNPYEQSRVKAALDAFAAATKLTFTETTEYDSATLKLALWSDPESPLQGEFHAPETTNEGFGKFNAGNDSWSRDESGGMLEFGGDGYQTLVHELGHALGLAHPHDTGGTSPVFPGVANPYEDVGIFELNQEVYTMMTYVSGGWRTSPWVAEKNGNLGQGTIGALDIAALQQKYGANKDYNKGDNVYYLPTENKVGTGWQAIWDADGIDTIRYDGTQNAVIDLNAATLQFAPGGGGELSYVEGINGGFTIAHGVVIENAIGGSGSDKIRGNSADNIIIPGAGDDIITDTGMFDTDIVYIDTTSDVAEFIYNLDSKGHIINYYSIDVYTEAFGLDALHNIERIAFKDKTLAFDYLEGEARDVTTSIAGLYKASFGREYDPGGMRYWAETHWIINDSEQRNIDLNEVAQQFLNSDEFDEPSENAAFLTNLYNNAFGRQADQGGYEYWLGHLDQGVSRLSVLTEFAYSDEMMELVSTELVGGVWLDTPSGFLESVLA